ncbi:class I SAM-dependent methyltransferase [Actinomyces trachealis]|nr:class I SAM-dependent methyltransferase [Actinomyces trachealis]
MKYVGVDIDDHALQVAQRRLPNAVFFRCDIQDWRVVSLGVYDVVVCSLVLGLLKDVENLSVLKQVNLVADVDSDSAVE